MSLLETPWHFVCSTGMFILGIALCFKAAPAFDCRLGRAFGLYFWHTIFCVFYAYNVAENGGDAVMYYQTSLLLDVEFSLGTAAVRFITAFFSRVIDASFIGTFLFFNIVGFLGLLAFDGSLRLAVQGKSNNVRRFATLIVLLPSISFWSSAIGKDAISFMSTGLALWASLNLGRRYWLMAFAVFAMFMVRPHVAVLLVAALAAAMIFSRRVHIAQRLLLGSVTVIGAVLLLPIVLSYGGLAGDVGVDQVGSYIEQRQGYNQEGGGGIDISSMPLPLQLFTYMFRPLPHEAHSFLSFAASIDNVLLLLLFAVGAYQFFILRRSYPFNNAVFICFYALSAWLMLGMTSANLGISVRQKWMFAPMLIFMIIAIVGKIKRPQGVVREAFPRHSFTVVR